jgi:4,5-dihydroxyphthalate decarboxylase
VSEFTITLGCNSYDRNLPVMDGRVPIEGCEVAAVKLPGEQLHVRALHRQEFDVTELSVSSYLMQVSKGENQYLALPVFTSRAFRHRCIYIRTDRGIDGPKDLEGKLVGLPEYQVTVALWVRGILQDEYGVDFKKLRYRNGGINRPGRQERLALDLPGDIDVEPVPKEKSLSDMLAAGELDALISPGEPTCFKEKHPKVRRLFTDHVGEEKAFYRKTGFLPMMHLIAVRKSMAEEHPWLAPNVYRAFVKAKQMVMAEYDKIAGYTANMLTLPWFADDLAATKDLMGNDYWPYGVERNRKEFEALARYSVEQHLAVRRVTAEEYFAPGTLDLPDA